MFGAVLITAAESGNLALKIRALKTRYFGEDTVEIKSNWLRIPKECEKRYLTKYGITEDELRGFVDHYYELISEADLQLIAAVIDKVHTQQRYPEPYYAPAIAYELVMQRVAQQCPEQSCVSVIIDDMTGATPNGNQYKRNLQYQHERLRKSGSRLRPNINFGPLRPNVKFINSSLSHLIQVADLVAYNIFRQFREYGEEWEIKNSDGLTRLPTYEWFMRLSKKFRQGPNRRIQGYGVVKFPIIRSVHWSLRKKDNS